MKSTKSFSTYFTPAAAMLALVTVLLHLAAPSALATNYYWDNNGAASGFGTAAGTWSATTVGDSTQGWSTDSTGVTLPGTVTTTTSDQLYFGNAGGVITVSGTVAANGLEFLTTAGGIILTNGTIQLGATSPQIECTNNHTAIYSAIVLPTGQQSYFYFSRPLGSASFLLNGQISGSGSLFFSPPSSVNFGGSSQTIQLGAANTYTGGTKITCPSSAPGHGDNLTVQALVDNALPTTTVLTLEGYDGSGTGGRTVAYDLNGNDQTLAGLVNQTGNTLRNQQILNSAGTAAMLTINNTTSYSFSGNINGTALGLTKTGAGTLTLGDINGYTGNTILNAGSLIGVVGGNCASSKVILNSATATLGVSVTDNTKSWTCSALTVSNTGTINFDFSTATPSATVSPLKITGLADFSAATPLLNVALSAGLTPGTYPLMKWGSTAGTSPTTNQLTINTMLPNTAASLSVVGTTLNLVITSVAVPIVKNNNIAPLNVGSSWVGSVVPASTNVAKWDGTVLAANTTSLGNNLTWAGIAIANPGGSVTIASGNTLTLGGAPFAIDMSAATADLTLNCLLALGAADVFDVASGRTLTLNNVISGSFPVALQDAGTTIFAGANIYTGNTTINAGTLKLGAANVIPNGAGNGNVSVAGTLDLNGYSDTINGLSGAGTVDNSAANTTSTLTVGSNDQGGTFTGVIQDSGSLATNNLVKIGTNTLVLAGSNTLSGTVTVSAGTLAVSNTTPFSAASGIALADGATLRADVDGEVIAAPVSVGAVNTTVTITAPIVPLASGGGTPTVSFNSAISGAGNVTFLGLNPYNAYGTINLKTQNTYTGSTLMTCSDAIIPSIGYTNNENIVVQLYAGNALPPTTVLTMDGTPGISSVNIRYCDLNLNGHSQTLAGLTNIPETFRAQRVISPDSASATGTLTVNNGSDYTFSGSLGGSGGSLGSGNGGNKFNLVKSGSGTLALSGANTYTGNTTINAGILELAQSSATLATNSTLTIASGAYLQLDNGAVINQVAALVTNGVAAGNGLYTSANSSGFITGSGSLQVVGAVVGPSDPASLTNSVSGNMLNLSWPAGQGWRLQMQTNSLSVGLGANWTYVTDGTLSSTNITISPTNPTVFFRLTYP